MTIALWWIRRDLRLTDNLALAAAISAARGLVPVFVLDPAILSSDQMGSAARVRMAFLLEGLRCLDADLHRRGSRLVVRHGDPVEELAKLASETGASALFAEEDPWPYARHRDARVAAALPLHLTTGLSARPIEAVRKADGTAYTVFTAFSRVWRELTPPTAGQIQHAPRSLPPVPELQSLPIPAEPSLPSENCFPPGEASARRRLADFLEGDDPAIWHYSDRRDRPDLDGTSQLSPYMRFGLVSAREAVVGAYRAMEAAPNAHCRLSAEKWLTELVWREFYLSIQAHFPETERRSFRANLRDIAWENGETEFSAWSHGQTGYPIVDAAMRQLAVTGWMHNRARMIVASFLVKDLLVDWRWGERWFMQHLLDGDPASNNGGWQWSAGTGTDAAPYFRIFHPVLQGQKHDPHGTFVRRWIPVLDRVPTRFIHTPWAMPTEVQQTSGCVIGRDYPAPIVDHAWARKRVLEAYARAKRSAAGEP